VVGFRRGGVGAKTGCPIWFSAVDAGFHWWCPSSTTFLILSLIVLLSLEFKCCCHMEGDVGLFLRSHRAVGFVD
jgi:hypothetical protein